MKNAPELESEERRRRAVEGGVEAHDSERLRFARGQRSRDGVRAIVELLHRVQNPLDRVVLDMVAPVDDARNGLMRDSRELGHVRHHRGLPRRPAADATLRHAGSPSGGHRTVTTSSYRALALTNETLVITDSERVVEARQPFESSVSPPMRRARRSSSGVVITTDGPFALASVTFS